MSCHDAKLTKFKGNNIIKQQIISVSCAQLTDTPLPCEYSLTGVL